MRVALGFKAHSGWAALVVVGRQRGDVVVVDRRRVDIVEEHWQKAPYHAAEELNREAARELVKRAIGTARRCGVREMRAALKREQARGNEPVATAILVGEPMPDWTAEEILAVHFRMHKAEGVLFREVLIRAGNECDLETVAVNEKLLPQEVEMILGWSPAETARQLAALGKSIGPPWAKDQKDATLAALIALDSSRT